MLKTVDVARVSAHFQVPIFDAETKKKLFNGFKANFKNSIWTLFWVVFPATWTINQKCQMTPPKNSNKKVEENKPALN